jgi:hypothetical protein
MKTTPPSIQLEDEWYAVRHSGEIPEVALHSALYYLCDDANGPGLRLTPEEHRWLVEAAAARYREMVQRDLNADNRDEPFYRGVHRAIVNWRRYERFCRRQGLPLDTFQHEVAVDLLLLLAREMSDVRGGRCRAPLNCSFAELSRFAAQLGLIDSMLPEEYETLCRRD